MRTFRPLPKNFYIKNLVHITARACELRTSPHIQLVAAKVEDWFLSHCVYDKPQAKQYAEHARLDIFAGLGFPQADPTHLETCLEFLYWAFSTGDLTDEGDLQAQPDRVKASVDICRQVLNNPNVPPPTYPYAAMLHDLFKRIQATASIGTCKRFVAAYKDFSNAQINQSLDRSRNELPSVEKFIQWRRAAVGASLAEAMVEYSLDLDIPDYVFADPIIRAMSDATTDIMTWPNDLCSFNKEQAENDFQNLLCVIMVERHLELQDAINVLTIMLEERESEYLSLKASLPSFGKEVDEKLSQYLSALENFVQGGIVWIYISPRYSHQTDKKRSLEAQYHHINLNAKL